MVSTTQYAVAIGSNRRHGRFGAPDGVVAAAVAALPEIVALSSIYRTRAIGPAGRQYANAAAILETDENPPALLARLKSIERGFGRRPGRRWGPRVIDLDILLWSGGLWASPGLAIPHPGLRGRAFVLDPLNEIAPGWRDPLTGFTIRQLRARLRRS